MTKDNESRGVVYAVSKPLWFSEVIVSAESVRRHMPDVTRELYLTPEVDLLLSSADRDLFHKVVVLDGVGFEHRPRFEAFDKTELEQVLYLDGDTYLVAPVYELFETLNDYDLAAACAPQHVHRLYYELGIDKVLPPVSSAIGEWNTGVMVFRNDERIRAFWKEWARLFQLTYEKGYVMDQASFRAAIANSDIRAIPLPDSYNFRANLRHFIRRPVKIIHAHGDLPAIAAELDKATGAYFYQPNPKLIFGMAPKGFRST